VARDDADLIHRVARAISARRRGLGLTQEALADRLELAVKNVQRIEAGAQNLTLASIDTETDSEVTTSVASVADAVSEAVEDMRALKGGLISRVTIHAIDVKGNHKVVAVNGTRDNKYWLWEGQGEPRLLPAEPIVITTGTARPTSTSRYTGPPR